MAHKVPADDGKRSLALDILNAPYISIEGEVSEEREGKKLAAWGEAGGFLSWALLCFGHPDPKMKTQNLIKSEPKLASCWRLKIA